MVACEQGIRKEYLKTLSYDQAGLLYAIGEISEKEWDWFKNEWIEVVEDALDEFILLRLENYTYN